jgi:acetyl-CoA acetyltransferase family protein
MAESIVIIDGGRRLPRADILVKNREPGLYARFSATQLGGMALKAALQRSRVPGELVGHVVMGMAEHSHRDSLYGAQGMRWRAGLPNEVPALTVSRIGGSGAEALAVGAEMLLAGLRMDPERPFFAVGGAESMQYPFVLYGARGKKLGDSVRKHGPIEAGTLPPGTYLQDVTLLGMYDPSAKMTMANTAEELGRRYLVTREQADAFGLRSHQNAKKARDAGWFDEEIEPVIVQRDGTVRPAEVRFDTHILEDPSPDAMSRLPALIEQGGIITAGNACAIVDGAAAMLVGKERDVKRHGLRPLARVCAIAVAGCEPQIMGWGPVPATRLALKRAELAGKDIDHVELNEMYAPQALACIHDFAEIGIDPDRVNPLGGAIAMGHPAGATGAILVLTCAYALRRTKKKYGLVTTCIAGGQGISVILESMA